MIVIVADGDGVLLGNSLPSEAVATDTASVGDVVARGDATAVVVDATAVADPDAAVAVVRSRAPETPVVVVGATAVDADIACEDTDGDAVAAAVERAERVAEYRASVSTLYEACRERALGQPGPDVREHREAADRRLADLPNDSDVVAAALRPEGDDG